MRLFPYRYEMQIGNNKAIFHPLNMAVLYCNKNMSEKEIIRNVKNQKQFNDWLVDDDFSYDQYVKNYIKGDSTNIDIKTLKMFITTRCNLDCSYCLIEENLKDRCKEAKDLSLENAIDILEKFSDVCCKQKASPRTIMLYGGEPMMNVGTLKKIIQFIRKKESEGGFNGQVELVLESNGTLITDEIADFLKDNNVFIIVSIDGIKEVHDCYRQKKQGGGSYQEAIKGYKILESHDCMVVISSVFTDKYADNIEKCIGEMTENIKPKSIGLNIFHILEKREIQNDKTRENYQKYIKAFELARDKGLYIEHIMRRIRPLVDRKVRIKDCGACGNRIVSDVSGNIGICEGLVGNEEYFFERDDLQSVKKDKTFLEWAKRTPLTMEMCIGCRASGICGGGCVNNALWQHGSVFAPDDYICESSKQFIDWALKQWYNLNNINDLITNENSIVFLNQNQRLKLIGKLKSEFVIPLQTISKQYEVKGE